MEHLPNKDDDETRQYKIDLLRQAICRAEERGDETRVLLLEAELRAVERGDVFDREQFLLDHTRRISRHRPDVLRDILALAHKAPDEVWTWDGLNPKIYESIPSYEDTFGYLLEKLGFSSFQEVVDSRADDLNRNVTILDLFGGGYFISNLANVSSITGVRLQNMDQELLSQTQASGRLDIAGEIERLIQSSKRKIIQGDLYSRETWLKINHANRQHESAGFDLIVCRPGGPFGHALKQKSIKDIKDDGLAREEIFVSLLNRTVSLLSNEGGMLFTQIPRLDTSIEIEDIFWRRYMNEMGEKGYAFIFDNDIGAYPRGEFAIIKNPT